MKFIYPAVFKKTEDGRYKGTFPDLEGCFGEGDTLDEAIESANAAAFDWISVELSEEVPELPPITDPDRKSTRLNSSHPSSSRMPSSA